jgi:hypothetical protein
MSIKKINGKWIAIERIAGTGLVGTGATSARAQSALRLAISLHLCGDAK